MQRAKPRYARWLDPQPSQQPSEHLVLSRFGLGRQQDTGQAALQEQHDCVVELGDSVYLDRPVPGPELQAVELMVGFWVAPGDLEHPLFAARGNRMAHPTRSARRAETGLSW